LHSTVSTFDWGDLSWSALIRMANQHYVMGRVALMQNSLGSAHLLMEQTVELALKAFVKRSDPNKDTKAYGHRLTKVLAEVSSDHQLLTNLTQDKEAVALIQMLQDGYNQVRYAEASFSFGSEPFGVELHRILGAFDRVACSMLRAMHALTDVYTCTILHVVPPLFTLFMHEFHEKVHLVLLPPAAGGEHQVSQQFPVQIILEPRASAS
jgi:HEPN domain-containing protein